LYKISIILPNLDGGGAERIAIYLANDWASRGYVVEFVLMQRVGNLLQMLNSSISVVDLRATRIRNVISPLKKYLLNSRPDVIMVGEIRDPDTASMAIRASLTGHLVLSTIHTNSAMGTVSRLLDMGIAPFLVASTLNTTVAQRLVRLLCPVCKKKTPFQSSIYPRHFTPYKELSFYYQAVGCNECYHTGYKGRKAVYEVIPIDEELAECIKNGNLAVYDLLKKKNIKTLSENAFELFEQGVTSIEEIYPLLSSHS
jgi:general secretion pathway protein E/type IV pilus assembly protein PilB